MTESVPSPGDGSFPFVCAVISAVLANRNLLLAGTIDSVDLATKVSSNNFPGRGGVSSQLPYARGSSRNGSMALGMVGKRLPIRELVRSGRVEGREQAY